MQQRSGLFKNDMSLRLFFRVAYTQTVTKLTEQVLMSRLFASRS